MTWTRGSPKTTDTKQLSLQIRTRWLLKQSFVHAAHHERNAHHRGRYLGPGAGNQRKQVTEGAREHQQRKKKKHKWGGGGANKGPRKGQPQPGGGQAKQKDKAAKGKGEAHQNAPGRPARPTRPGRTSTRTHAQDPGVASSDPQGEVSASTRNSPGAPAESPVQRRTVRETRRVSVYAKSTRVWALHKQQLALKVT